MIDWFKAWYSSFTITIAKAATGYSPHPESKALFLKPTQYMSPNTEKSTWCLNRRFTPTD